MSYDAARPADDDYISVGPDVIRQNFEALRTGQIADAGTLSGKAAGNASGNIPINNGTLCTNLNADKLDGYDAASFAATLHTHGAATTSDNGFMSNTDKIKLDGISEGAGANPNAFQTFTSGGVTITPTSSTDTATLIEGANIDITMNNTNRSITIAVTGTVPNATHATTADSATTATTADSATTATSADSATTATTATNATNATNAVNADTVDSLHAADFALVNHASHTGEAASLVSNGYFKLANGLMINWGNISCAAGTSTAVTWSLAYTTALFSVTVTPFNSDASKSLSVPSLIGKTGCYIYNSNTVATNAYYIAIGR